MNPFLKAAFEAGQRQAELELKEKLEAELKKRQHAVGWREQSKTPPKLNGCGK